MAPSTSLAAPGAFSSQKGSHNRPASPEESSPLPSPTPRPAHSLRISGGEARLPFSRLEIKRIVSREFRLRGWGPEAKLESFHPICSTHSFSLRSEPVLGTQWSPEASQAGRRHTHLY